MKSIYLESSYYFFNSNSKGRASIWKVCPSLELITGGRGEERSPPHSGQIRQPQKGPQRELIQEIEINSRPFFPRDQRISYAKLNIFPEKKANKVRTLLCSYSQTFWPHSLSLRTKNLGILIY
jgi:hypothetical protein